MVGVRDTLRENISINHWETNWPWLWIELQRGGSSLGIAVSLLKSFQDG